jgi:hypothetical protein
MQTRLLDRKEVVAGEPSRNGVHRLAPGFGRKARFGIVAADSFWKRHRSAGLLATPRLTAARAGVHRPASSGVPGLPGGLVAKHFTREREIAQHDRHDHGRADPEEGERSKGNVTRSDL